MKALLQAYKTLRTNIQYSNLDNNLKVILVTSSVQSEGKTPLPPILPFLWHSLFKGVID